MRLLLFMVIVCGISTAACTATGSSTAQNEVPGNSVTPVNSPSPQVNTYWVISAILLNGSKLYSDVLQLPTDDKESVAAAVNAWGRSHGPMTNAASVYPFQSAEDAQKFRRERGNVVHLDDLTSDDLIPRLCVGQPKASATDYWVISVEKTEYPVFSPVDHVTETHYISSPILLRPHTEQAVSRAVSDWIEEKGGRGLSVDEANTRKFANIGDAEAFISKSGMEPSDLTAEQLDKYLCANQPEESQPGPKSQPKH